MFCIFKGCSEKDPDKYYNSKDKYAIKFPRQWKIKEGYKGTSVTALCPEMGSTKQFHDKVYIVVDQIPSGIKVSKYFEGFENEMSKTIKDYHEIEKGDATIADEDAKWFTFMESNGIDNLKNKIYLIKHDNRIYTITFTSTSDNYSQYSNRFEAIVLSFEFE
jgi:hypothetical protein